MYIDRKQKPHPFQALSRAIVYQQLAGAAASAIWKRFVRLIAGVNQEQASSGQKRISVAYVENQKATEAYEDEQESFDLLVSMVTPERVLAATSEDLRSVGLSKQKVVYVNDLASHFAAGKLDKMHTMSDEDVRYVSKQSCV